MNAMKKRPVYILISAMILVLVICAFALSSMESRLEYHLTQEQILSMREQYPIYKNDAPMVDTIDVPLQKVSERMESFVYGEVTGDVSTYSFVNLTGNAEWDNKMAQVSPNNKTTFFEYPITVISDTEGKYKKGEQITIAANVIFQECRPKLKKGMKVVLPVARDDEKPERNYYSLTGMYYITDEGYALSAFDESTAQMKRSYNGIKVEDLLKQLKK